MITDPLPRVDVAHLPTPLEPLPRLSAYLKGPTLWVKRDDQTGLATGGNKARKLEFLVADALAEEADTLITCGAAQSNHARQTAAAAAKCGLAAVLVLEGHSPSASRGNLLLDHLLGAELAWSGDDPPPERMEAVAQELRDRGRRPYLIPYGGSNRIGASGYAAAMEELLSQCAQREETFSHIVLASSSGGTQAGLCLAARALGFEGRILGISVAPSADDLRSNLAELATDTAALLDLELAFEPQDFDVEDAYVGRGYGVISDLEREAIRVLAREEGLLLDPVYTGRAFGGLIDRIKQGQFSAEDAVLFWHTGGTGGLFARADDLLEGAAGV